LAAAYDDSNTAVKTACVHQHVQSPVSRDRIVDRPLTAPRVGHVQLDDVNITSGAKAIDDTGAGTLRVAHRRQHDIAPTGKRLGDHELVVDGPSSAQREPRRPLGVTLLPRDNAPVSQSGTSGAALGSVP
jgi:hypothetical protein